MRIAIRLPLILAPTISIVLSIIAAGQAPKSTMKAMVVHEYGGPEVLKYEDLPRPEPKEDQILIRVIAAGVNPVDGLIRSGKFAQFFKSKLPLIPGYDISGNVEKVGAKMTKFKVGDPVYAYIGLNEGGGYANMRSQPRKRPRPSRHLLII